MTRVMFYQGCWQRIKFQYLIRGVGKEFCFREKEKEKEKKKKKKKRRRRRRRGGGGKKNNNLFSFELGFRINNLVELGF
jgi:hypothetical protein